MQILYIFRLATKYDKTLFGFSRYRMGTKKRGSLISPYISYPPGSKTIWKPYYYRIVQKFLSEAMHRSLYMFDVMSARPIKWYSLVKTTVYFMSLYLFRKGCLQP